MDGRRCITALTACMIIGACGDFDTYPLTPEPQPEPQTEAAAAELYESTAFTGAGSPDVSRQTLSSSVDIAAPGFCQDIDVRIEEYFSVVSQVWWNGEQLARTRDKVNAETRFTDLESGQWVASRRRFTRTALYDEEGRVADVYTSGVSDQTMEAGEGLISYAFGSMIVSFDYSGGPPEISSDENGRFSDDDPFSICALLGG